MVTYIGQPIEFDENRSVEELVELVVIIIPSNNYEFI